MSAPQVAYLGLGSMGYPIAGLIANRVSSLGYLPLLVYSRTTARAEELRITHPVEVDTSLEQFAQVSGRVISLEQSTVDPELVLELDKKAKEANVTYIICPIAGSPNRAISGDLVVLLASGDEAARVSIIPLLIPVIDKKIIKLGDNPGESLRLKLCRNSIVMSLIEMIAEGMALGEASGVGQGKVKELLDALFPDSLLGIYVGRMLENSHKTQVAGSLAAAQRMLAIPFTW